SCLCCASEIFRSVPLFSASARTESEKEVRQLLSEPTWEKPITRGLSPSAVFCSLDWLQPKIASRGIRKNVNRIISLIIRYFNYQHPGCHDWSASVTRFDGHTYKYVPVSST